VQKRLSSAQYHYPQSTRLFQPELPDEPVFPIQHVDINWDRLIAKRPIVLETVDTMPAYLLKPEILTLLDLEKHPNYRLIMDIVWSTGARISEVLSLKPSSFIDGGYGFGVFLRTLKQRPGRSN